MLFIWNWFEVREGIAVSLIFVLIPIIIHAEKRHKTREKESERRHKEQLEYHESLYKSS